MAEWKPPGAIEVADSSMGAPQMGEMLLDPSLRYRTAQGQNRQPWGRMAMETAPFIAGAAVTGLGPLAAMRGPLGMLARIGGAGVAGAGAQAATIPVRAAMGEPTPKTLLEGVGESARAGRNQMVAQLGGEALSPLLRKASLRLMEAGLKSPARAERIYQSKAQLPTMKTAGAEKSLPAAAIKHGVVLGGQTNPRATQKIGGLRAASATRTIEILAEQSKAGITYKPTDPAMADEITALKNRMAPRADAAAARDYIDRQWRTFIEGRRMKSPAGRMGRLQPLTPNELNEIKQAAQTEAKRIYESKPTGTRQSLRAEFNEALAKGARKALERGDTQLASRAGIKPQLGEQNARTSELMSLEDVVGAREMTPRTFGGSRWWIDPRLYLENPTISSYLASQVLGNAPGPTAVSQIAPRIAAYTGQQLWPMPDAPPWARNRP